MRFPINRRAAVFGVLLLAFIGRVVLQLRQRLDPTPALPPFEAFQSGALPYPALLASQAAIIAVGLFILRGLLTQSWRPNPKLGRVLRILGGVYLAAAAFRLVAGLTILRHVAFFALPIPSTFHMVLAGMVLVVADFHLSSGQRKRRDGPTR